MTFYDRINEQMSLQKKTRKNMCEQTGLSYSTIASLFNRKSKNIGIDTIRLIAEYLDVSVDYLVTGKTAFPSYVSEADGALYRSSDNEMLKEIVRIFDVIDIQGKTRLLSSAYELESKELSKKQKL